MRLRGLPMFVLASGLNVSTASAQTFDNASIIELHKAGLGAGAIIAKINTLPCNYDISTAALVRLRKADVPSTAIAAMIDRCGSAGPAPVDPNDPAVMHPPGIYLQQSGSQPAVLALIRPSKAGSVKVSGNGSLLWPRNSTLLIPDAASRTVAATSLPIFYFYFAPNDRRVSDFGNANSAAAQSPDEFTLVQLKAKENARAVSIGRVTALGGRIGVDPKAAMPFRSEEIAASVFKVTPAAPLSRGEYAFVITGANSAARVYDFAVQ